MQIISVMVVLLFSIDTIVKIDVNAIIKITEHMIINIRTIMFFSKKPSSGIPTHAVVTIKTRHKISSAIIQVNRFEMITFYQVIVKKVVKRTVKKS